MNIYGVKHEHLWGKHERLWGMLSEPVGKPVNSYATLGDIAGVSTLI